MTNRKNVLTALLAFERPLDEVLVELRSLPWDCRQELVFMSPEHLSVLLRRFIAGELTESAVEEWANAIEGRDDVGVAESHATVLKRVLHELANPALEGALSKKRAIELDRQLIKLAATP